MKPSINLYTGNNPDNSISNIDLSQNDTNVVRNPGLDPVINRTIAIIDSHNPDATARSISVLNLPNIILEQVFLNLSQKELISVNSTCSAFNGLVKHIRTHRGLDFKQKLNLSTNAVIKIIQMLATGYSSLFTYMSLYGCSTFSYDQTLLIIRNLNSKGYPYLTYVLVSKEHIDTFTNIQKRLYPENSIQKIEFVQDPRELHAVEMCQYLDGMGQQISIFEQTLSATAYHSFVHAFKSL